MSSPLCESPSPTPPGNTEATKPGGLRALSRAQALLPSVYYATGVPVSLLQASYGWVTEWKGGIELLGSGESPIWVTVAFSYLPGAI